MKTDIFQRRIEDEEVEGWRIKEDGDERVVMHKPNYGSLGAHLLVALLTVWWTIGIGNVLYAAYCYFGKSPKKVVRDEMAGRRSEDEYSATADPIEAAPGAR